MLRKKKVVIPCAVLTAKLSFQWDSKITLTIRFVSIKLVLISFSRFFLCIQTSEGLKLARFLGLFGKQIFQHLTSSNSRSY